MKKTPWYPGNINPVREGWYEREWPDDVYLDYWTGESWVDSSPMTRLVFRSQSLPWRGVAK